MNSILQASTNSMSSTLIAKEEFKNAVLRGLSKKHKSIPSKYFYDEKGCELFNQISHHPDYYLTACELEILTSHKKELVELLNTDSFNLAELGPGEGIKTQILIQEFLQDALSFTYYPIDISEKYLQTLIAHFNQQLPTLEINALHSDYFAGLEWLKLNTSTRNLVLFLGSSIGNFNWQATQKFLQHLGNSLQAGDYVLIGFDLRKEIDVLMRAYNDNAGLTREFNLNLLTRINRELEANFSIDKFQHYETYNVCTGAMESYLVSKEEQMIAINSLKQSFLFQPYESIHVECSFKYLLSQIEQLAQETGFELIQTFTDSRGYFADSLWQRKK